MKILNIIEIFLNASNLVKAFASSTTPEGATATPTTIHQNENGLTHNVGVLFKPEANPGDSITANFGHESKLLKDVILSHTFEHWLKERLNERRTEVLEKLKKLPPDQNIRWFEWSYPKQSFRFSLVRDQDLLLALGSVSFNMTIQVPVHRDGYVDSSTGIRLYGEMYDLYGFDREYRDNLTLFSDYGAFAQTGYIQASDGGRVYKIKISFNGDISYISFNFK